MRAYPLTEWLVVPFFLVPVIAGIGLVWWARDAHRRAQAPFREEGAATAERWLRPEGPGGTLPGEASRRIRDLYRADETVAFEHPAVSGRVVTAHEAMGSAPWAFVEAVPSPLSPRQLADPELRYRIELGRAPATVEEAEPFTALARLLEEGPDLDFLRKAPLPPSTKRYVLGRWRRAGVEAPFLEEADAFLALVGRVVAEPSPHPGLGAHRRGDLLLLVPGGGAPWTVVPPGRRDGRLDEAIVARGPPGSAAALVWTITGAARGHEANLWAGHLRTPLAGTFAFRPRWETWRQAPWVRRLKGPVVAVLLAALLLPLALLISIRKRRHLDEARVRFINEMAHDLRTPLASLRLHADMLSEGRGKPEKRAGYLHVLSREAARLSSLLANLLDLSRLEQGRRRLETGTVDVGDLAYRAARELALLHPEREGDLAAEGPDATWARGDPTALSRCLANLLENAGKFTAPGTPIRLSWAVEDDTVVVRVADEGPGIAPDERGRVFERYARGRATRKDGVPGTGLGLSLVKELVEGMGGSVALQASEVGAVFEIRLPGADRG